MVKIVKYLDDVFHFICGQSRVDLLNFNGEEPISVLSDDNIL